jgi:para-aminobenzoate synthetase / 4-amino-4-deoxychorismate lyase
MPVIEVRFDDLGGPAPRSFRFAEPVGVIEARRPEEVTDALAAAEGAAGRGLWVAGFVAYEAAPGLDPALQVRERSADDPFGALPLLWFAMFDQAHETSLPEPRASSSALALGDAWRPSITRERYDDRIARVREHIRSGDTYQVNYTLRLRAALEGDERGLYRDLALAQRGRYAAYLNAGRYRVLSASPELFFSIEGDLITTRPMKGTIARGRWPEEDGGMARRLRSSAKDRAENAMIVDLVRNDLGRISRPGSVRVPAMFDAERYETVWQLTSTVTSELSAGTGLVEVFRALFPSGSVTGAPKIRSTQIITDLEDSARGVYTGAIGYLAPEGSGEPRANFNVAIRTVVLDTRTGTAEYGVGGGITYDSRAEAEYDEVLTKARVLSVRRPRFDLFESIRHEPAEGGFRHLDLHLRRLAASAAYFGFAYDESAVREALDKVADGASEPLRVRLTLSREGTIDVAVSDPPPPSDGPVRVSLHEGEPVDPDDALLYHKTTLRERYEAAAAAHPNADDVLLVNTHGQITESAVANVAVQLDGRWWTPPIECGLLPGTGRAVALHDGSLAERAISVDDLHRAEGIALVSSVRGWRTATVVAEGRSGRRGF